MSHAQRISAGTWYHKRSLTNATQLVDLTMAGGCGQIEHHLPVRSEKAPAKVESLTTNRRSLEFADIVVGVASPDHAALEWLAEFLDPWWRPSQGVV